MNLKTYALASSELNPNARKASVVPGSGSVDASVTSVSVVSSLLEYSVVVESSSWLEEPVLYSLLPSVVLLECSVVVTLLECSVVVSLLECSVVVSLLECSVVSVVSLLEGSVVVSLRAWVTEYRIIKAVVTLGRIHIRKRLKQMSKLKQSKQSGVFMKYILWTL